jgi:hypothetical protein
MPIRQETVLKAGVNVGWGALFVLVSLATLRSRVWKIRALLLPFALLAYLMLIHLLFEAISRHHIPVLGILILIASAGLAAQGRSPRPWVEGTLVA